MEKKSILVTGGAGYIGSHTVLQLLLGRYKVVVIGNLDNSSEVSLDRVKKLAGHAANLYFHKKPLLYYNNNIIGTQFLLEVMEAHGCKKLVFSSSTTVYGWPKEVPCTEEFMLSATNPYGRTKVRDYIHVVDLADGHIAAVNMLSDAKMGYDVYNLGTGKGTSKIPLVMADRRPGDSEVVYGSTVKAERELKWRYLFSLSCNNDLQEQTNVIVNNISFYGFCSAKFGVDEMCMDQWNWASKNP
ncbi:hypothetical protein MKW92_049068 [Papaver armeniacum]|nr:hypothetical protein MKW92_049068 [Papaver armeniacum]